ncbi:MAG: hypothetical protein HRT38_19565 [Alteromonadaceae bacterium]|nr:hypothetical protein [Alteromonadaceae bacterium]
MDQFSKEENKIMISALKEFKKSLKNIDRDSLDAFALVIFINACYDTGSYQSNRHGVLSYYDKARKSANILTVLHDKDDELFNWTIRLAHDVLISHCIVHPDLCMPN